MRDYVLLYINGERHEVRGEDAFIPLANYLRYSKGLTGTKIVCAEGDCGACTVLRKPHRSDEFRGINSCIAPVFLMDGSQLVTVEGLAQDDQLSEVQQAMVRCFGSQCGFCTPGFVMALTDMFERNESVDDQDIKNHLTGNLCRCTGYQPIIDAAKSVEPKKVVRVKERYKNPAIDDALRVAVKTEVSVTYGDRTYYGPTTLGAAVKFKSTHCESLRIYSGATDLGVQDNKKVIHPHTVMSLHLVDDLYELSHEDGKITVGAKTSLRELEEYCRDHVPEFADFMKIFASPQIKESATLIGNLGNGSPIADTLPFLMVAKTEIICVGKGGERVVPIKDYFKGYKNFNLAADEIIEAVRFEVPPQGSKLALYKVSQRRDLDISCVNAAILARGTSEKLDDLRIAYGGVGPVPIRAEKTENALKDLSGASLSKAEKILADEIAPFSDVRGTDWYRHKLAFNFLRKFAEEMSGGN